jgi:hypothetical protein
MRRVLILAAVLGFLSVAPGQAGTIVTTLAQTSGSLDPMAMPGQSDAQKFIPQADAILDLVTLRLGRVPGLGSPEDPFVSPVVSLYADDGTGPGALVGALIAPGTYMPMYTLMSIAFGGNNLRLEADTAYWIVLESPSSAYAWRSLTPALVPSCPVSQCGPAYAPDNMVKVTNSGWLPNLNNSSGLTLTARMQIDVSDAPAAVPEPATTWLLVPLLAMPLFRRRAPRA